MDEVFVRRTLCPRPGLVMNQRRQGEVSDLWRRQTQGRVGPVAGPLAQAAGCGASPTAGGAPSAPRPLASRGARNTHTGGING